MPGTAYVSGSGAAGAAPAGPPRDRCTLHGGEPASVCAMRFATFSERLPKFMRFSLSRCACR